MYSFIFYLIIIVPKLFIALAAHNVPVNSKTAHAPPPPPGQILGHLTFLKNFGQIRRYVVSLDGQVPTRLSCKEGQIPHPPGMLKQQCKTFFHA